MKPNALIPDKIRIDKFYFQNGYIENSTDAVGQTPSSFQFQVGYDSGFDMQNNGASTQITVTITGVKDNNEIISKASYEIHFYFTIENFQDLIEVDPNDGQIKVFQGLGNALASVTYSTTRGLVLGRLQGTSLEKFIMPVINPNDLFLKKNEG